MLRTVKHYRSPGQGLRNKERKVCSSEQTYDLWLARLKSVKTAKTI